MTSPSVSSTPRGAGSDSDSDAGAAAGLPRRLGLWSAIAVLVGTTIGSGIFRSPAGIADKLPGPLPLMAVWVTGGIFALCGALTLADPAGNRGNCCIGAVRGVLRFGAHLALVAIE